MAYYPALRRRAGAGRARSSCEAGGRALGAAGLGAGARATRAARTRSPVPPNSGRGARSARKPGDLNGRSIRNMGPQLARRLGEMAIKSIMAAKAAPSST